MKKHVLFPLIITSIFTGLNAIQVIPQGDIGGKIGQGLGAGISQGMEQRQALLLKLYLENEERIRNYIIQYDEIIKEVYFSPTHPDLFIPNELANCTVQNGKFTSQKCYRLDYKLSKKFNRVFGDGNLIEWCWNLDLTNNHPKKKDLNCGRMHITIQMMDENDMEISKHSFYKWINVQYGETQSLNDRWFLKFDMMKHFSYFKTTIQTT